MVLLFDHLAHAIKFFQRPQRLFDLFQNNAFVLFRDGSPDCDRERVICGRAEIFMEIYNANLRPNVAFFR